MANTASTTNKALRCPFAIQELANGVDPLFHPSEALPGCKLEPERVKNAVGDLNPLAKQYNHQIVAEQNVLQYCSRQLCEKPGCVGSTPPPSSCTLPMLPSCTDAAKGQASIKGGLGVAQSFAEILFLQYAQGVHGSEFGFGKADKEKMLDILRLHTAVFDKVQRAKYVAERQGSNLLHHIVYALENGRDPGAPGGPYKFIAYVGHDTNIANLAALLDLHWQLPEYPQDDMPPGGALVFELRQRPNQPPSVDAFFAAQSPDAMRNYTGPAPGHVPVKTDDVPVKIRRCPPGGDICAMDDFVVPLAQFIAMTRPILERNPGCLTD